MVLTSTPEIEAVTGTMIEQPPFGIVDPAAFVIVSDTTVTLVQVPLLVVGLINTPTGILSTKGASSVCATPVELESKIVSVDAPPMATTDGWNPLDDAGKGATVSVPDIGDELLPPFVVVIPPAGIVLVSTPAITPVTVTLIKQVPFAGIVPAERLKLLPFDAATTMPFAHVVVAAGAGALSNPAGYVSTKAAPVTAKAFALFNVIVIRLVPPTPTAAGTKVLLAFAPGAAVTVSTAESHCVAFGAGAHT